MTQYRLHGFPLLALLVVLSAFSFPTDAIVGDTCDACLAPVTSDSDNTNTASAPTGGTAANVPRLYWLSVGSRTEEHFGGCFLDSEPFPLIESILPAADRPIWSHRLFITSECTTRADRFAFVSTAQTCVSCVLERSAWMYWDTEHSGICMKNSSANALLRYVFPIFDWKLPATSIEHCYPLVKTCYQCLYRGTPIATLTGASVPSVQWYSMSTGGPEDLGGCLWTDGPFLSVIGGMNAVGFEPIITPITNSNACPGASPRFGRISTAQTCVSCTQEGNFWCNWGETDSGFCVESVAACDWLKREFPRLLFGPVATSKEECCALGETLAGCTEGNLDTPPSQCIWCGRGDANIGVCVYTEDPEADGVCLGTPTGKSLHGLGVELRKIDRGALSIFTAPKLNLDLSCSACLATGDDATGPVWCSASSADPNERVADGLCVKYESKDACQSALPSSWGLIVPESGNRDTIHCCDLSFDCYSCMEREGACSWCTIGVGPFSIGAHGVCRRRRVDSVGGNSVDSCDGLSIGEDVGGYGYSTIEVQNAQECNSQKLKHRVELELFFGHMTCSDCLEAHGAWCEISSDDGVDLGVLGTLGGVCLKRSNTCGATVAHLFPGRVDIRYHIDAVCPH